MATKFTAYGQIRASKNGKTTILGTIEEKVAGEIASRLRRLGFDVEPSPPYTLFRNADHAVQVARAACDDSY